MVYAFDFDHTLSEIELQEFAVKLKRQGNEIWVVTMRRDDDFNNQKIAPVLKKLGLTKYSVVFCNNKPKWEFIKGINADVYIDNISDEFEMIKSFTNAVPLLWA